MRIRELARNGAGVWPPQWSNSSHSSLENAVLNDVRLIVGTEFVRIDAHHQGIPHLGLIFVDLAVRDSFYRKLKENLGRSLAEIADLEIEPEQGVTEYQVWTDRGILTWLRIMTKIKNSRLISCFFI